MSLWKLQDTFLLVNMSIPIIFVSWDTCKVKYALPFSSQILKRMLSLKRFICQPVNCRTAAGRISNELRLRVQYDEFKTQYF
jgi:predicted PP-loop superfamily ATPase